MKLELLGLIIFIVCFILFSRDNNLHISGNLKLENDTVIIDANGKIFIPQFNIKEEMSINEIKSEFNKATSSSMADKWNLPFIRIIRDNYMKTNLSKTEFI